jgi:hypothetical protein
MKKIIIPVMLIVVIGAVFAYQFFQGHVTGEDVKNAKEVFNNFCINSRDNYEEAYAVLSEHNKKDISLELFKEWRTMEAKCIEYDKYRFDTIKKFSTPKFEGVRYQKAVQLSGSVIVKDLIKNEVTEGLGKIYIVREKEQWKVLHRITADEAKSSIDQYKKDLESLGR